MNEESVQNPVFLPNIALDSCWHPFMNIALQNDGKCCDILRRPQVKKALHQAQCWSGGDSFNSEY
jgi:hypothetical protein